MVITTSERLIIKRIESCDIEPFTQLLTDTEILELIPQVPFSSEQVSEIFEKSLAVDLETIKSNKCIAGIYSKEDSTLIGLALFLFNDDGDKELGYRFRPAYWGKGYGTETASAMLHFYFDELDAELVSADVNIANPGSTKILEKFMSPIKEFFNESDNCTDRRYAVTRLEWKKQTA